MRTEYMLIYLFIMCVMIFIPGCPAQEEGVEELTPKTSHVYNIEHDGYKFIIFEDPEDSVFAMIHPDCPKAHPQPETIEEVVSAIAGGQDGTEELVEVEVEEEGKPVRILPSIDKILEPKEDINLIPLVIIE